MLKYPVNEWQSNFDDNAHFFKVEHEKGMTYKVSVSDSPELTDADVTEVKGSFLSWMFGYDEPVNILGRDMKLVATKDGMDLAYDGSFLASGKDYNARPSWVWIFVVLCISLVFLGGMLGGAIGFLGSAVCISVSKQSTPTFNRVLTCVFVTILTWAVLIVIGLQFGMFLQ
ncbi:MAG: hypothetical protein FWE51_02300 [Coriobacteriia bacterium]|nr:hypothetical protein [Coriobacteriia bacterium]